MTFEISEAGALDCGDDVICLDLAKNHKVQTAILLKSFT